MSSFYTVLSTLQPSAANQQSAEMFSQQFLSALYPDTDFREGTGIYDTVIRPTSSLLALVEAAINFYFTNYTLQGVNNNTPSNFVDAILSNWFSTRQMGTNAVINVNLNFASQVPVTLTTSQVFSPDGVTTYSPEQSAVYPASNMQFNAATQEWLLNVNLMATSTGPQYNISSGNLLYFTNFNPFFLGGSINYLVSSGTSTETNSEFIKRTQSSISTRNLINRLSIDAYLQNTFPSLTNIEVVGYGDAAMQRDQVEVYSAPISGNVSFHMGGYVDIYAGTPTSSGYTTVSLDASGNGLIPGANYSILNAGSAASAMATVPASAAMASSFPYSVDAGTGGVIPSGDVLFSSQQITQVSFGSAYAGGTAGVQLFNFTEMNSIQAALEMSSTRVLCANYLIRSPGTFFLTVNLSSASPNPLSVNLAALTQTYIGALAMGQVFSVSDWLAGMSIPGILLPVTVDYIYYGTDGSIVSGSFSDYVPHQTSGGSITNFTASFGTLAPPEGLFQFVLSSATLSQVAL